jgi:RNA-binding protein YhbY
MATLQEVHQELSNRGLVGIHVTLGDKADQYTKEEIVDKLVFSMNNVAEFKDADID